MFSYALIFKNELLFAINLDRYSHIANIVCNSERGKTMLAT